MKIMIAGAWDETNENLLSSAFQIAKVAAEKKHIIITGGEQESLILLRMEH